MSTAHALELNSVSRSFGAALAVNDISLAVRVGERCILLGANGAGKTTLFNVILGDLRPSSGSILFFGRDISALSTPRRIRLGMRRTYQTSLTFASLTVLECLFLALRGLGQRRFSIGSLAPEMHEAAILGKSAGLEGILQAKAGELSHGESRQLEIAMATVGKPRLLLLDEPAAGLSDAERESLRKSLLALPRGITVIMIEHDVELALAVADKVVVMHNGRLVAEGTPEDIASNRQVHEIYTGNTVH